MGAAARQLFDGVDGDVARAGDHRSLARELFSPPAQHLGREEHAAVAGRLGAHRRAAPPLALAGEYARLPAVGDTPVLAEEIADFAAADADVAGRDVGVVADVPVKLCHEGLAEAHDFGVRTTSWVEVAAALAAADTQSGEGVLEDLLEAEELHDAQVHRWVEAQAALVGAECAVELHPESSVDVHCAAVVLPGHPEDDLPFWFAEALDEPRLRVLGTGGEYGSQGLQHFR